MKVPCLPLLIVVILMSVIGVAVGCDYSRGSIEGIMTYESGEPVAGAIIRAERSEFPGILIRTDETGYFSFSDIPAGKWEVEFYTENGLGVGLESVTVRGGETTRLDFTIGAKPPPTGLPRIIFPWSTNDSSLAEITVERKRTILYQNQRFQTYQDRAQNSLILSFYFFSFTLSAISLRSSSISIKR
jgi:hypothetical protein